MTVADIAEVCVMAINRVVNRSRGCCIKQIKLFREDIAVRFFIISDLHLGEETDMQQLYTRTRTLCRKIRESTTPGEQIPIILLGDIVDGGNPDAFCAAKKLLTKIEQELKDYSTTFDFVPGNHDLHGTDLAAFDKFISKYGVPKFSENRAYNRQYGGVNFIFADSNLSRDHRACGEIDVAAIIELVKGGMTNVLLCHHSFTQEYGDTHDVINGGERFLEILAGHEIKFLIHGHTHRAAIDVHPYTVKEIGCGSFSKDSKKMGNIYKQFTVGCIREGTIVSIERWIDTDDGGEPFAYTQLFPKERQFKDPDSVGKQIYDDVPDYISRRVVVHNAEAVDLNSLTAIADVVKKRGSNVLVMGDAGHGKSVEMQHLAAELGRTAKFPFLYSLKQYCGQAIEDLCPEEYRDLLPSRQVLIFGGYDELGTYIDVFDRNLRAFCKDFPSVCIVISARGNFCQHKISQENVFANFTVCSLEELNERDIVQYISAHRIDSQALVVEAKEKGLADLLRNPFYLTRVVNLYLKYKQLPPRTELMDSLIEECMERDEGKFSEDLEENRKNSLQLLGKAATAMLLLQKQKLENTKEYQELFQLEERNLMNFSGLFRRENNSWSFTHNNFKEYLAARYISQLSKEDALALISDGYGIMPTWLNAVGFLLGMNTDWDVQQWLLEHEPEAIVKYRPESMDSTARSCLFREIFEHYEGKRLWIDQTIISYKDLAEFSSSEESMRYLLDKIENPACFISQVSAICLVQYFSNLYGNELAVSQLLLRCCISMPESEESITIVCRALQAIYRLGMLNDLVAKELVTRYYSCEVSRVRAVMYEVLTAMHFQDEHVQFFLDGISYLGGNGRFTNETISLADGLKELNCEKSIKTAMSAISKGKVRFYADSKVYITLCQKATELHRQEVADFYVFMLDCFANNAEKVDRAKSMAVKTFFEETGTIEEATIDLCNRFGEKRKCYLLDTLFDDPATLEKVRIAYEDGRLLSDIVLYDIACRYGSDAQYIACSKSVYSKGKKSFPPREPRVNYEELRAASDASYFAMLFDKKAAKQMLEDLTRYAGNPNVTVEELWENKISAEIHWSSPLMYLQYSIYNYVENKNSLVINFLQCVQWESFVLQEAQHMLSNTKNLKVFAWQRDTLIDIAQKTVEGSDILDAVKYDNDSVEVCPDVAAAIYLISYFEYPINIDSMKELVSFPEYVFCGENNGEKYEYLSKYVPVGDILAKIEMDLKSGTVCRSTVRDHIEYCEKKKYRGIKDIAVMLCTDESQDELLQNYALRYLYEVFGSDCVRNEVVPFASEQLLLQIYHVCRDVPKEPLCKVMQDKFAESKSFELMAPLIILGSELALKEYLLYAKENHRIPERVDSFDGPTEAISKISDPQKIGILAELLQIAMEPSFRDGDFFTLRSGVTNALVNCGKEKPEAVIAVFERQIALEKQEINIRCCNDAIERIGQLTRGKFRQPMSLRDVKTVLQRMIS